MLTVNFEQVQAVAGAGGGDEFVYDPDWDDDWEIDRSLLGDDDEADADTGLGEGEVDVAAFSVVPDSDEEVTEVTKSWVQAGAVLSAECMTPIYFTRCRDDR